MSTELPGAIARSIRVGKIQKRYQTDRWIFLHAMVESAIEFGREFDLLWNFEFQTGFAKEQIEFGQLWQMEIASFGHLVGFLRGTKVV